MPRARRTAIVECAIGPEATEVFSRAAIVGLVCGPVQSDRGGSVVPFPAVFWLRISGRLLVLLQADEHRCAAVQMEVVEERSVVGCTEQLPAESCGFNFRRGMGHAVGGHENPVVVRFVQRSVGAIACIDDGHTFHGPVDNHAAQRAIGRFAVVFPIGHHEAGHLSRRRKGTFHDHMGLGEPAVFGAFHEASLARGGRPDVIPAEAVAAEVAVFDVGLATVVWLSPMPARPATDFRSRAVQCVLLILLAAIAVLLHAGEQVVSASTWIAIHLVPLVVGIDKRGWLQGQFFGRIVIVPEFSLDVHPEVVCAAKVKVAERCIRQGGCLFPLGPVFHLVETRLVFVGAEPCAGTSLVAPAVRHGAHTAISGIGGGVEPEQPSVGLHPHHLVSISDGHCFDALAAAVSVHPRVAVQVPHQLRVIHIPELVEEVGVHMVWGLPIDPAGIRQRSVVVCPFPGRTTPVLAEPDSRIGVAVIGQVCAVDEVQFVCVVEHQGFGEDRALTEGAVVHLAIRHHIDPAATAVGMDEAHAPERRGPIQQREAAVETWAHRIAAQQGSVDFSSREFDGVGGIIAPVPPHDGCAVLDGAIARSKVQLAVQPSVVAEVCHDVQFATQDGESGIEPRQASLLGSRVSQA